MSGNIENRETIYNILSTVFVGGITFLTAPVFTRLLGPEQYGVFSVAYSWVTIISCVFGFQVKEAIATGIHDFRDDYVRFRGAALSAGLFFSLLCFLIVLPFTGKLAVVFSQTRFFVLLVLITGFSHFIFGFVQNVCVFEKKAGLNLILSVSLVCFVIVFSLLFIFHGDPSDKYIGRMLGFAVPYSLYAVVSVVVLLRITNSLFAREYWCYALRIGIPIVFHALSQNALSQSDKIMLQLQHIPEADIGIYSFYVSMVTILITVMNALTVSFRPFYQDYLAAQENMLIEKKASNLSELFSVITAAFMLVSREVGLIMAGREYVSGSNIAVILGVGVYFMFVFQFPVNYELFCKKAKMIAAGTIAAAIINIVLNYILIKVTGMYGAAVATVISYCVLALIHFGTAAGIKSCTFTTGLLFFSRYIIFTVIIAAVSVFSKEHMIIRWGLCLLMVIYEMNKLYKRKSVF